MVEGRCSRQPQTPETSGDLPRLGVRQALAIARGAVSGVTKSPVAKSRRGVALLLVIFTLLILVVLSVEFAYTTRANITMNGNIASSTQAFYHARSASKIAELAVNARKSFPKINNYLKMFGRAAGQGMQLWRQACEFVNIFCTGKANFFGMDILDFSKEKSVGVGDKGACSCTVTAEDGRINLNAAATPPLATKLAAAGGTNPGSPGASPLTGAAASRSVANMRGRNNLGFQLIGLFKPMVDTGHFDSEDEVFELVLNIMDWTDSDESKTDIDPQGNFIDSSGAEGTDYGKYGYDIKNAKMDSVGELQLIEGMTTDAFCRVRDKLTVFATEKIDVNDADLFVLKAVLCQAIVDDAERFNMCWSYLPGQLQGPPIDQALIMLDTCRTLKKAAYSTPFVRFSRFQNFFRQFPGVTGNAALNIDWRLAGSQLGTTTKMVRVEASGEYRGAKRKITLIIDSASGAVVHFRTE